MVMKYPLTYASQHNNINYCVCMWINVKILRYAHDTGKLMCWGRRLRPHENSENLLHDRRTRMKSCSRYAQKCNSLEIFKTYSTRRNRANAITQCTIHTRSLSNKRFTKLMEWNTSATNLQACTILRCDPICVHSSSDNMSWLI